MSGDGVPEELPGLAWLRRLRQNRFNRTGIAALVAVAGLIGLTLGPAVAVMAWQASLTDQGPERLVHGVGDQVEDGPVTFVVHEVRCGRAERESTQGRLCEVTLGARNTGAEEVTVPSLAQSLHVTQGARHLPVRDGTGDFGPLAPRQAATAVIRFDVPPEATITHLEVRADVYSRGERVAVGLPYPLQTR